MKICVLDALTVGKDIDMTKLSQCGELVVYGLTEPEEVANRIKDVDVVITNKVQLNEDNLKEALHLKMIALFATGYNNIDIAYAKQKGIAVANVAGYSTESVAQHTFGMLLYLLEKLRHYDEAMKMRQIKTDKPFTYIEWPYHQLYGKKIGIIGLGAIGKAVARIAVAFGMEVMYYSTSGHNRSGEEYQRVSLQTLLKESDVVSIHAPYNQNTHHLIGYSELKQMKATAILLNLGRGGIIVEEDLVQALNENIIAAAALDVLEKEPIEADNPLFKVQDPYKLLVTPHIAWASIEAREQLIEEVIMDIQAFNTGVWRNRIV